MQGLVKSLTIIEHIDVIDYGGFRFVAIGKASRVD